MTRQEGKRDLETETLRTLRRRVAELEAQVAHHSQTEGALQKSEERYRAIFENAVGGFFQSTPQGRFLRVNKAFAKMCGYHSPEEMVSEIKDIAGQHYVYSQDREVFISLLMEKGVVENFEHETRRKDGSTFWTSVSARAVKGTDDQILHYEGTHEDIDQRKKAERLLADAEEQYRSLFETSTNAILIRNRGGVITMVNEAAMTLLGASKADDLMGKAYLDFVHPEDRVLSAERVEKIFQIVPGQREPHEYESRGISPREHRMVNLKGDVIYVESTGVAFHHKGELFIQGIFRNITERKQVEERLRLSEERYRTLSENAPFGMMMVNQETHFTYINPKFKELFGYDLTDIPEGRSWFRKAYPDPSYRREVIAAWVQDSEGSSIGEKRPRIFEVTCKDGSKKVINFISVQIETGATLVTCEDITPQRRLEAQYHHAQKMEAVGTLAGGVAHDFNNLLQAVLGYAEMLLMEKKSDEPGHRALMSIREAAQRGAELTRQLLTFSRKVQSKPRPLHLNQEIVQIEQLLQRTIPKMIQVDLRLGGDLWTVSADPVQVGQVLMNLAVNARDAMPEGGRLVIGTQNKTLDEEFCRGHIGSKPGQHVLLSVSDTGQGMEKEVLSHLFEPFFTTKGIGRGTGLGLAMVYGIVKGHGGYIECESELGKGTVFKIYLPAIEREAEQGKSEKKKKPRGGTETILLVDDEESLRDLGKAILSAFGYTVLTASDGKGALETYRVEKERIHLLILDLIMPGVGGLKCLEELLRINPDVRVVIATGYDPEDSVKAHLEGKGRGFITKPYDMSEMLRVVREALDT